VHAYREDGTPSTVLLDRLANKKGPGVSRGLW